MTKPSIALAELLEKGADADLLRQMIQHVAQRMMEMDAEGICAPAGIEPTARAVPLHLQVHLGNGRRAVWP